MTQTETDIPLSVALARIAEEIEALRRVSARLDGVIGPGVGRFDLDDPATMAALQGLDQLTQELTSLRPLLQRLSEMAERTENPDARPALRAVALGSLRARLSDAGRPAGEPRAGEPDYF